MRNKLLLIGYLLVLLGGVRPLHAQGTIITGTVVQVSYQGYLTDNGQPANGRYDLRFSVYTSPTNGSPLPGGIVETRDVPVANGLFTAYLDLDAGLFAASTPRWLEIAARSAQFTPTPEWNTLMPRQPALPTPQALYAFKAGEVTSGAISTASLQDGAVTEAKLASGAVGNLGLGDGSVTGAKIAGGQVVRSLNGLSDAVTLAAGDGLALIMTNNGAIMAARRDCTDYIDCYWALHGNILGGDEFLGSLNLQPLELRVNDNRAMLYEFTGADTAPRITGGYRGNLVSGIGGTISGGGESTGINRVTASWGTVGGGRSNVVGAMAGSIGGGTNNTIRSSSDAATIAGGGSNTIQANADYANISGGRLNTIDLASKGSTIGGGEDNLITNAFFAAIGGGQQNAVLFIAHTATIGGGFGNTNSAEDASVAGGRLNIIEPYSLSATIGGGRQNSVKTRTSYATIGGGYLNTIQTNTDYATIAGGRQNTVESNALYSTIGGGWINTIEAKAFYGSIGGGNANSIGTNADFATIGGGYHNTIQTNADYATIPGGIFAKAANYGQMAYASGRFVADGDAQTSVLVVRRSSAAFFPELFLDASNKRISIPAESCWAFDILIVGRRVNNDCASFQIRGMIDNTGGTTALIGTPIKTTLGARGEFWDASVEADDANDALVIKGGGDGSTTRWVATVRTTEVTY